MTDVHQIDQWNKEMFEKLVTSEQILYTQASYDGELEKVALVQCDSSDEHLLTTLSYCRHLKKVKKLRLEDIMKHVPRVHKGRSRQHFKSVMVRILCSLFSSIVHVPIFIRHLLRIRMSRWKKLNKDSC